MRHDTQTRDRRPAREVLLSPIAAAALALALAAPGPLAAQAEQDAPAAADGAAVAEAVLTTAVEERQPVDTLSTVPADVERVFLWTRITGAEDTTAVSHVWYRDGEEAARVEVPVRSADWRTHTSKRILPSWVGPWRVDVENADGQLLESVSFRVEEPAAVVPDSAAGR